MLDLWCDICDEYYCCRCVRLILMLAFYSVQVEVNGAISSGTAVMHIESFRLSRIGHNLPHVANTEHPDPTFESTVRMEDVTI